jgi:hypothetical protein
METRIFALPPLPPPPIAGLTFTEEMNMRIYRLVELDTWMNNQAFATVVETGIWLNQKQEMLNACYQLVLINTPGLTYAELMIQLEIDAWLTDALNESFNDLVVG